MTTISIDLLAHVTGGAPENQATPAPSTAAGQRSPDGYGRGEGPSTHALDRNGQSVPLGYGGGMFGGGR